MIRAWRIVKLRHAERALDGEGARLHGGRWNSPGLRAVYAAESRALAILEVLAGLGTRAPLPSYGLIGLDFDEEQVEELDREALPRGWNHSPPGPASQGIGDRWLVERRSLVLRVPSALVPAECNYLLNPEHRDFGALVSGPVEPLRIDARLRGG